MACLAHAVQLGREYGALQSLNADVLVVAPNGMRAIAMMPPLTKLPFPVLADDQRAAFRAFGYATKLVLIQQSGVSVIDRGGIVRLVHRSTNPVQALPLDRVRAALREASDAAGDVSQPIATVPR